MSSSVVCLQVGQCGIQLGSSLLETVAEEQSQVNAGGELSETFFRKQRFVASDSYSMKGVMEKTLARSVLVDMEPKVIASTVRNDSPLFGVDPRSCFAKQSGSGNNWARGFFDYGSSYGDDILDKVRREVEKCDMFRGFLVMQSLAGGTGSGLGARVAQLLKDDFQSNFLVNHCVWPYESGEVIVQNYNTLLTLSHLHECSDGIIVTENESLLQTCQRRLDIPRPTFHDLNKVAAKALASVLLPAERQRAAAVERDPFDFGSPDDDDGYGAGGPEPNLLGSLVDHLCSHPAFKMLTMKCAPQVQPKALAFTEFKWGTILKWLRQMLIVSSSLDETLDWGVKIDSGSSINRVHCKSMGNFLVLRGREAFDADVASFADKALYPSWATDPLKVMCSNQRFLKHEMFATVVSNSQASIVPMRKVLDKAYNMLDEKAYVHHYERCGLAYGDMEHAFANIEDIIGKYESL